MSIHFYKYHGLGNDYLVYDCSRYKNVLTKEAVQKICDRNFGLGSDGILAGPFFTEEGIGVRIYNPDGSEAEKSGNGVRIFAKYLRDAGYWSEQELCLNTLGGKVSVRYDSGSSMTVSMGRLLFTKESVGAVRVPDETVDIPLSFHGITYPCTCVSIGNPHCVILMEDISKERVCEIGAYSEKADYFPNRINTQLLKVIDRNNIQIEIYERGAGYTLASGSSSCAAAGAARRLGLVDSDICVHMPGGILQIKIDEEWNVKMTGSVAYVGELILSDEFIWENHIGIKAL